MSHPADPCLQDRSKVRKIGPGVYVCPEEHLHLFAIEMCEAAGYPPTEKNLRTIEEEFRKGVRDRWPNLPIIEDWK